MLLRTKAHVHSSCTHVSAACVVRLCEMHTVHACVCTVCVLLSVCTHSVYLARSAFYLAQCVSCIVCVLLSVCVCTVCVLHGVHFILHSVYLILHRCKCTVAGAQAKDAQVP